MPSPIVHAATGYAIFRQHRKRQELDQNDSDPILALLVVAAALIPDVDFLAGFVHGQISRVHNQGTHSLFTGLGFSVLLGFAGRLMGREFKRWTLLAMAAFESHVVLDFFSGSRRGMMLLWPFSRTRYKFPFKLFYGVRWDRSVASWNHVWTVFTEVVFLAIAVLIARSLRKRNG